MNNSFNDPTSYRNISKAISTGLNITDHQFIAKDTYYSPEEGEDTANKFHYVDFEIPIFLKDISDFFRKITVLKFAEFNINLKFIDNMIISSREGIKTTIKSCHLIYKKLNYMKMIILNILNC